MTEPDLSKIFAWRSYRTEKTRPHDIRKDPSGRVAVIVLRRGRSRADGDFAINASLLANAAAAVREGRLACAYVVQVERQTVLHFTTVEQAIANIGSAPPLDGEFGPYHWLGEDFMPTGFSGGASDEEPF